jgi:hypothetical protein
MSEQLDLLGGPPKPAGPQQPVPPVLYRSYEQRRDVTDERRGCAHCLMNRERWHRNPSSIPQWRSKADVRTNPAVVLITRGDGSTLELCAQHEREHDERGHRDD